MDVKELIVQDWVVLDRTYPPTRKIPTQLTLQDMIDIDQGRECEPLPLTKEMLIKNGFKRIYDPPNLFSYLRTFSLWYEGDGEFSLSIGSQLISLKYVHELQRALRCGGLWELAENFKV